VEDVCRVENRDLIDSELRRANGDHEDRLASFQMLPSVTANLTQNLESESYHQLGKLSHNRKCNYYSRI